MGRSMDDIDPLTLACAPPPNESPQEKEAREKREADARRVSEQIDEQIRNEKAARKKKKAVKVLLLGQSESGKTATLKNFQLMYAHREWAEERASWRSVIQLNLVRSVNEILDILARELHIQSTPTPATYPDSPASDDELEEITSVSRRPSMVNAVNSGPSGTSSNNTPNGDATSTSKSNSSSKLKLTEKHKLLKLRLAPLQGVEMDLQRRLGAAATELYTTDVTTAAPFDFSALRNYQNSKKSKEFCIHSTNGWKSALDKFKVFRGAGAGQDTDALSVNKQKEHDDEITDIIASCRDDIEELWRDPIIRDMLNRKKCRIEDSAGFFLNDVDRVASHNYVPTDDDVIRARLRTLGVQEYRLTFDHGPAIGQEWWLFDVGGTRSSRAAWYPYFDDVDAIIFLAPISCFDEKLAEDRRVNRLEDSYLLWRSVCSCKLLSKTQMIVFLNKCDLLQAKLMRGVRVRDHVPSFGERRNDVGTATKYFQQHFKEILKQCSPVPRPFFVHHTSVIDTKSTAVTLGAVEESILRDHLRRADLM